MEKKISQFIYWTPRILSIIFLCFLALMSLDVFSPGLSFWQIALGLFMHNIPVFILLAVLLISWKREIVGGIVFISVGLLYIIVMAIQAPVNGYMALSWNFAVAGPSFLIGILFIINWLKKTR